MKYYEEEKNGKTYCVWETDKGTKEKLEKYRKNSYEKKRAEKRIAMIEKSENTKRLEELEKSFSGTNTQKITNMKEQIDILKSLIK